MCVCDIYVQYVDNICEYCDEYYIQNTEQYSVYRVFCSVHQYDSIGI